MNSERPVKADVGIIMGSDSDFSAIEATVKMLHYFGIRYDTRVISAHRTPEKASEYATVAVKHGIKVIIAAAGGAAHLAGVLASYTTLPVIGIPLKGDALNGMDSLLATVQMPAGVPVATVAIGKSGPVNAAILAVQILALQRPKLVKRLNAYKKTLAKKVEKGNQQVQSQLEKMHE